MAMQGSHGRSAAAKLMATQGSHDSLPKQALAFLGRLSQKDVNPKSYMGGDGVTVATQLRAAKARQSP